MSILVKSYVDNVTITAKIINNEQIMPNTEQMIPANDIPGNLPPLLLRDTTPKIIEIMEKISPNP